MGWPIIKNSLEIFIHRPLAENDLIRIFSKLLKITIGLIQVYLHLFYVQGVEMPRTIDEAYNLDIKNVNNLWPDAVNKEMTKWINWMYFNTKKEYIILNLKAFNLYHYA